MPHQIQAIEYDETIEIVAEEKFRTVEEAIAWCEARRGAKLSEGDTEFGFILMTESESEAMGHFPFSHPHRWYEVHGVTETGEVDYLFQGE